MYKYAEGLKSRARARKISREFKWMGPMLLS